MLLALPWLWWPLMAPECPHSLERWMAVSGHYIPGKLSLSSHQVHGTLSVSHGTRRVTFWPSCSGFSCSHAQNSSETLNSPDVIDKARTLNVSPAPLWRINAAIYVQRWSVRGVPCIRFISIRAFSGRPLAKPVLNSRQTSPATSFN